MNSKKAENDSSKALDDEAVSFADEAAAGASSGSSTGSLEDQLAQATAERDANAERWQRAQADLENYRRRVQRELEQERQYQSLTLLRDFLPGMDNLQRAIDAANVSHNLDELIRGVEMVERQFQDVLARYSVVPIESVGQPFDPNLHEAIQQMPSQDYPPMMVIGEAERGYKLHERVVRPSKVIVSSGPPSNAEV
jgi:molecular chaperone GrpE